MGASQSSPVAVDEITTAYIQTPRLSHDFYKQHTSGENINPGDEINLLSHVPLELMSKVSLHRSLDLSFNLIGEIPTGNNVCCISEVFTILILELPLNLPHLTVLNLSHNSISEIPDSIFGFLHLRLLDLSFNIIEKIPSTLCLLHELRKIDLSNNKITSLPSSFNNLRRLEKLNISNNNIDQIPTSLGSVSTLQVILTSGNPLESRVAALKSSELIEYLRDRYRETTASYLPSGNDHLVGYRNWKGAEST